jgi:phosphate transport system substrate-binding protein
MLLKSKGRKLSLIVLCLMMVAVVLAACGDNTATTAPATTAPATTAAATSAAATSAAATTKAATTAAITTGAATTAAATTGAATTSAGTTGAATSSAALATPSNGYKLSANVTLSGSGASFPDKAYQAWIANFATANPSVKLSYKSVGSGAGRKAFFAGEVDFAGSDAYPSKTELDTYAKPVVTIPTLVGGVTVSYNLPGVQSGALKLSPEILGGLYTGKITKWNDAAIKAENPSLTLPDKNVTFAVRADSSGTSDVFSKYLAEISADYKALGIAGSQPEWGKGGIQVSKGDQNPGVATLIKQNEGMIGYVDYADAVAQKLTFAALKNKAGDYVLPSQDSFALAEPDGGVPDNLQVKVVNSAAKGAYPIAATSWIILPKDFADKDKGEAVVTFLWWVTHDSKQISAAKELGFAQLPANVIPKVETALKGVTANGAAILK